ncbi:MAG: hypothetical protein Ta2B_01650 [Termitinemataceae bacterium]|nr:MAG: hypothetical protein Ta2B_01650 [Termitinemataceae bacterium]
MCLKTVKFPIDFFTLFMKRRVLKNIYLFGVFFLFLSCGESDPPIGRFIEEQLERLRAEASVEVLEFYLDKIPTAGATQIDNNENIITVTVPTGYDLRAVDYFVLHTGDGSSSYGNASLYFPFDFTIVGKNGFDITYTVYTVVDTNGATKKKEYVQVIPKGTKVSDIKLNIADAIPRMAGFSNFVSAKIGDISIWLPDLSHFGFNFKLMPSGNAIFGTGNMGLPVDRYERSFPVAYPTGNPTGFFDANCMYAGIYYGSTTTIVEECRLKEPLVFVLTYEVN